MLYLAGGLAGHYHQAQGVTLFLEVGDAFRSHRNDGSGLDEPGILLEGVVKFVHLAALEQTLVSHIVPLSLWEPYIARCSSVGAARSGDGRSQDIVAEEVFFVALVCLGKLRIVVIERPAHRDSGLRSLVSSIIDVGAQGIAELDSGLKVLVMIGEYPYTAVQVGVLGGVSLENRSKHSELHPAGIKLGVAGALFIPVLHVSAYVVPPVSVANV